MPEAESLKLNYEKRPPIYQRRRWLIVLLAVTLTLAGSAWRWGPAVRGQFRLLRAQHQCLNYTAPADQVLDSDSLFLRHVMCAPVPMAPPPQCWSDLVAAGGISQPPLPEIVVFLHERKTPGGRRRLVVVAEEPHGVSFHSHVYQCAGLNARPKQVSVTDIGKLELDRKGALPPYNFRVYAGTADANDPTHFSLRWEVCGGKGITDCYLQDDDTVRIKVHADPIP